MKRRCESDELVACRLVSMHAKCGASLVPEFYVEWVRRIVGGLASQGRHGNVLVDSATGL